MNPLTYILNTTAERFDARVCLCSEDRDTHIALTHDADGIKAFIRAEQLRLLEEIKDIVTGEMEAASSDAEVDAYRCVLAALTL